MHIFKGKPVFYVVNNKRQYNRASKGASHLNLKIKPEVEHSIFGTIYSQMKA